MTSHSSNFQRLLVDMDGVIADSTDPWLAHYRFVTGDTLTPRQLKTYDIPAHAKYPDMIYKALATSDAFRKAHPYPQAIASLRVLAGKFQVYGVSYSHESVADGHRQKIDWWNHYLPFLHENRLVLTKHKFLVKGDYLVEDSPANIEAWLAEWPHGRAFLVDQTYNRQYSHERCTRVQNLAGVVDALQTWSRGER